MRFALAVHGGPAAGQASRSALNFAVAALAAGHEIQRVFFQQDGVLNGSALDVVPRDETDPAAQWAQLGRKHHIDLVLCVASALRRGILDASEADRHARGTGNADPAFTISGLGQLMESALEADRLITFGA